MHTCDGCGEHIYEGSVMVNYEEYFAKRQVNALRIACEACTKEPGGGGDFHKLWELGWVKDHYIDLLDTVLSGLSPESRFPKWSSKAARQFWHLGVDAHPLLAKHVYAPIETVHCPGSRTS